MTHICIYIQYLDVWVIRRVGNDWSDPHCIIYVLIALTEDRSITVGIMQHMSNKCHCLQYHFLPLDVTASYILGL